jgi:hypothetical protein
MIPEQNSFAEINYRVKVYALKLRTGAYKPSSDRPGLGVISLLIQWLR